MGWIKTFEDQYTNILQVKCCNKSKNTTHTIAHIYFTQSSISL